eukprot:GEMP01038994.1.p1 GENE.GEMP01038994.1~~GEMP01038994.1.p1  ORF type:complete len:367 (+),score=83.82 GEMP01038994.1:161-1261(+)
MMEIVKQLMSGKIPGSTDATKQQLADRVSADVNADMEDDARMRSFQSHYQGNLQFGVEQSPQIFQTDLWSDTVRDGQTSLNPRFVCGSYPTQPYHLHVRAALSGLEGACDGLDKGSCEDSKLHCHWDASREHCADNSKTTFPDFQFSRPVTNVHMVLKDMTSRKLLWNQYFKAPKGRVSSILSDLQEEDPVTVCPQKEDGKYLKNSPEERKLDRHKLDTYCSKEAQKEPAQQSDAHESSYAAKDDKNVAATTKTGKKTTVTATAGDHNAPQVRDFMATNLRHDHASSHFLTRFQKLCPSVYGPPHWYELTATTLERGVGKLVGWMRIIEHHPLDSPSAAAVFRQGDILLEIPSGQSDNLTIWPSGF